ncbi:hypothetical protein JCM12856_22420 [Spirochaeta dissipatitropha]
MVGGCAAYKNILTADIAKAIYVVLDVSGYKGHELHNGVEVATLEQGFQFLRIEEITSDLLDFRWKRAELSLAAVEHAQFHALFDCQCAAGGADNSGSAEK